MKVPEQIIEALYASGNPTVPEELIPPLSDDEMKFAFLNSRFIRNRFILSDIIGFIGMLDENFWHRIDMEVRRIAASQRT